MVAPISCTYFSRQKTVVNTRFPGVWPSLFTVGKPRRANIFSTAFFNAHRRGRDKIDHLAITQAAQKWFEQDKAQALSEPLHVLLTRIISEVIGSRKARSFLLPRRLEKHEAIQGLFDARVLHLVKRGYADANNPGVRFNIYTLDYGTYVDLMGTSRQPELGFEAESVEPTSEIIVPFDDKRSIRRIVLNEKTLVGANE